MLQTVKMKPHRLVQVVKLLGIQHPCLANKHKQVFLRHFSSDNDRQVVYRLKSRGLIQLKGPDSVMLLNGLLTNNVELLETEDKAQYSMMLNVQGRVMYDLMLYNSSSWLGEPSVLLECDRELSGKLVSDIKKYKIRKKVTLEDVSNNQMVLARLGNSGEDTPEGVVLDVPDPRVPTFGARMVTTSNSLKGSNVVENEDEYHKQRLEWGIPEGPSDLPPGNCFPLESNLVLMNGVSFSKGCYLGQELTARTHHTGVTRKRLMPLTLQGPSEDIEAGANIVNAKGKSVGKFRSCLGDRGIGLIRTAEINSELKVLTNSGDVLVTVKRPKWWPDDVS